MRDNGRAGLEVLHGDLVQHAETIIAKYPNSRSAILPLLFLVQSVEGYVTEAGMRDVATLLGLTSAQVLAASSFYTMLRKRPSGEYLISICRNISCTHRGARRIIAEVAQRLGIEPGEQTSDGRFALESAECLATCDGAPAMQINYEDFYDVTADDVMRLVDALARGDEVTSLRGDTVRPLKDVSRETALSAVVPRSPRPQRTVGGESVPGDMAPGFRPKEPGDEGDDA